MITYNDILLRLRDNPYDLPMMCGGEMLLTALEGLEANNDRTTLDAITKIAQHYNISAHKV